MILLFDEWTARRPLLITSVFFAMGIILAYYTDISLIFMYIIILQLFICLILAILNEKIRVALIFAAIFLAGFSLMGWQEIRYQSQLSTARYNGYEQVEVIGQIREDLSSLQGNKILLDPVYIAGNPVKYGLIQLDKRYIPVHLSNGEIVKIELSLHQPDMQKNPGGFSSYNYLKRKGIYSQGYYEDEMEKFGFLRNVFIETIISLKYRLIDILDQTVEKPYNELYKAFLLGERDGLPEEWDSSFTLSGVNHLLAISGIHVGFIVMIFLFILKLFKLPVGIRNFLLSILIICYIILTGFRVSVFRAGILSLAFLWAPFFKRHGDVLNILGLTAFLNMLINPYQIFSIGFQFSYFILLMIILWHKILKGYITTVFSVSTAALFGSSPITVYYFNLITPIALVANVWAIPLVGVLISAALIGLLLGLVHPLFSYLIFQLIIYPSKLLTIGTGLMSIIPYGHFELATPSPAVIVFVVCLLIISPLHLRKRIFPLNENMRKKRLYYILAFSLIFVLINIIIPLMNRQLEVTFISIGQGDSIHIRTPDNQHLLIDGGGYLGFDLSRGEYTILPYLKYLGVKKLDLVFITHFDADHAAGISDLIGSRDIGLLVLPFNYEENELAVDIINKAEDENIPVVLAGQGDYIELGEVKLNIINPEPDVRPTSRNENSLVIKLGYRDFSIMLTGDLEEEGERRLVDSGYRLDSDILKLGHHGSSSSSSEIFLESVSARHAIISVGESNNYGHPSASVLKRAAQNGIQIWRTDIHGAVRIRTDGYRYKIEGHIPTD
ncbi:MAG: DNA internalization-related competence protein ComEC/Rec2 [Halanaerobiales bacterium]